MDDDASLPKATLNSFIKESIGSNLKSTQEFNELILEISNGFSLKKIFPVRKRIKQIIFKDS